MLKEMTPQQLAQTLAVIEAILDDRPFTAWRDNAGWREWSAYAANGEW